MAETPHPKQHLGLAQMRAILEDQHESVIYRGRLISLVADLPTEAEVAAADDFYKAQAETNLGEQIKKMQETLESLRAGTLAPTPAAPEALPVRAAADPSLPGGRTLPPEGPDEDERAAARARLVQAAEAGPHETVTRTGPEGKPTSEPARSVVIAPEVKPEKGKGK